MTSEDILASITWHYMVGNKAITGTQLAEHKARLACPACEDKTPGSQAIAEAVERR